MKERDKFTQLLLKDNKQKEKMWDDRFILEKIPQYDAFKDPNYLSLSLLKTKSQIDEKNIKNKHSNIKDRIYSSHYAINSLNKQIQTPKQKNNEDSSNINTNNINSKEKIKKKRPYSIYFNRNQFSFLNNNNSNSKKDMNNTNIINTNKNIFYNFFANKFKTKNESPNNNNTNIYTKDLNSFNDNFFYKTTKNADINKNIQNFMTFRESSYQSLENDNSVIKKYKNVLNEFKAIKDIWNEIYVNSEYQNSFEEMINNIDNKEDIQNILINEKKQILQFKHDFLKFMNVISKREATIENIKKLDKIFKQNRNLAQFNKLVNEKSRSHSNLKVENYYDELEEKNNIQIESDINNSLKLLRINSINVIHQFNKFRTTNNYLMTSNKIDINKLKSNYEFNKDYLIKMKNDLDFLAYSNIKILYDFKTNDPFLINLTPEKSNPKLKKLPASEELMTTIKNYLYILAQEDLLHKINVKKDIKKNKSQGFDAKEHKVNNDEIITNKNAKYNCNEIKNINCLKIKTQKEYSIFIQNNKNNNINTDNKIKKIKNIYINNKSKEREKEREKERVKKINIEKKNEIPKTTAAQLQKKFEFYNQLKQDLTDRSEKKENIENNDKNENDDYSNKQENTNKKDNNINKTNETEEENNEYKYIWFKDSFNYFKSIYNEYYNKLSKKTIELFLIKNNPDDFIYGINPKILFCKKNNNSNEIYGMCVTSYYLENNKLILKINHLSSLEKEEDESDISPYLKDNIEFKIYEQLLEKIKTLSYEIIELNLYINKQNKYLLNYFVNYCKFEKKEEEEKRQNENEYNDFVDDNKKIILRLVNKNDNNEIIKKIKESNDIKYNNTSIISLINKEEFSNSIEKEKELDKEKDIFKLNSNKYFYKFINTFNLNILLNYLTKDKIYKLTNISNEINTSFTENMTNYSSLFIKEKNNNLDNIKNILPDCSLIETNDKTKYAYITSILNTKVFSFMSTIYSQKIYNIYKINVPKKNKEKKIYSIDTSDEKMQFYIYQCEEESSLKKEINKSNNENFNIFDYFNELINDKAIDNKTTDCILNLNIGESKEEIKRLWVPSFKINTQIICDKIPKLKDIIIQNNEEKQFKIKEYIELLNISYGINELSENEFIYEPNVNEDIVIDKDFIFAISHKSIKNQYNNSIVFLAYITKDSFINTNK